jgi:hypothetical protein
MAKKKTAAKRPKKKKRLKIVDLPTCTHMSAFHDVRMPTIAALALVSAATHAVRHGYDDATDWLESAVNALLEAFDIDCEFEDDGTMVLTVNPEVSDG